jgi:hypothetical protein
MSRHPKTSPRCVIEMKVSDRSPREARELAAVYFQNPTVSVMLLLKVRIRRLDGTFVAVCILWIRPDDNGIEDEKEGSRLHFGSVAAHEFGTGSYDRPRKKKILVGPK